MAVRNAAGNKRTRFACLETARCMVATTVSVLTVAVVVMVTIAAFRPVDSYSLSIVNGMDTFPYWSTTTNTKASSAAANTTQPQVIIAKRVNVKFALEASNPSGRKDIRFGNFSVRVVEMPDYPSFDGMKDIASFPVSGQFTVKRQGMHKLWSNFSLTDAGKLSYIANTYGYDGTFKTMVLVNPYPYNVSGSGTPAAAEPNHGVTYYCWPVLLGWSAAVESSRDVDGVPCTPRYELSIDVDSFLPRWASSAPAPAPIAG